MPFLLTWINFDEPSQCICCIQQMDLHPWPPIYSRRIFHKLHIFDWSAVALRFHYFCIKLFIFSNFELFAHNVYCDINNNWARKEPNQNSINSKTAFYIFQFTKFQQLWSKLQQKIGMQPLIWETEFDSREKPTQLANLPIKTYEITISGNIFGKNVIELVYTRIKLSTATLAEGV